MIVVQESTGSQAAAGTPNLSPAEPLPKDYFLVPGAAHRPFFSVASRVSRVIGFAAALQPAWQYFSHPGSAYFHWHTHRSIGLQAGPDCS